MELILGEIFSWRAGTGRAPALRRGGRTMLGELVCLLLGVEHHLLISPLCELSVGVEISAVRGDLALLGRVYLVVWLWVRVLVKGGGIERLGVGVPPGLLLLHRVWIMVCLRGRGGGGCRSGIVCGRYALAGNGGVWWVGSGCIHCVIFGRVPVLGNENCHGLERGKGEREGEKEKKGRERRGGLGCCFVVNYGE